MNGTASGRFAHHGNVSRVATEGCNILMDPVEDGNLVHIAVISQQAIRVLGSKRRMREEAKTAETKIETDKDDALPGEGASVVNGGRAAAVDHSPTMNPDKDRMLPCR
jgi:hypothetical protein